ncbi:hypothetical protein CAOG_03752 [Capsaspora owczarzaki ATCC 30864]|nr:hypothetical protein CAOG_03752 [Capsaspora owczarzaki ATCC 30864]|eukprot:XP_004363480.1 hypothetical protein CAOG_03752 [Capsaspora owczarzaki ATCC 30864]
MDLGMLAKDPANCSPALFDGYDLALGLHAFRSGQYLIHCPLPYAIILGGTDVNEAQELTNEQLDLMTLAVRRARGIVAFNESLSAPALKRWPFLDGSRLRIIPQAVQIDTPQPPTPRAPTLHERLGLPVHPSRPADLAPIVLLLVAGLRPVKDPTFLFDIVSCWHRLDSRVHLAVIGPELTPKCTSQVREAADRSPGVHILSAVPYAEALWLMSQADFLLNSSLSEGLASAVLEAMSLSVPLLARNIPGNAAVIQHGTTGCLFNQPAEMVASALAYLPSSFAAPWLDDAAIAKLQNAVLSDSDISTIRSAAQTAAQCTLAEVTDRRSTLVAAAHRYVEHNHACDVEAAAYHGILRDWLISS